MSRLTFEEAKTRADRDSRTLGTAFLHLARRNPRAIAVRDVRGQMSRIKLAAVALALYPLLDLADDEGCVGVLLPPGQAGALANLMLSLAGRTAVNVNHTAGASQIERMCRLAGVRTIVSAQAYLERLGDPALPGRVLLAEDLLARLPKARVIYQMLRVMLVRPEEIDRSRPGQAAALIYSSGSTGEPKGAQLTHQQILANCDAIMEHLALYPDRDVVVTPLPLFHCFGLIVGMWLCLAQGFTIAAQADPRDGAALGKLVEEAGGTLIISTPTFVRGYLRRIEPEQMKTLRFAVVGAERCPAELRAAFRRRYHAELLEGYGATELGPVVTVNPEEAPRDGSVGRPLPGIDVFTMDPESREILPPGETGVLVVRSPARMLGYLDRPDLTEQAFVHGGYDTGDIGRVDEEGYVYVTGRLARFAKIGGEMVPLDSLESALQQYLDERYRDVPVDIAVAAVHDRRKGERVVVLHTGLPCPPDEAIAALDRWPALFRPRSNDFYLVEAIPVLGTGKRDLGAIKDLAEASSAAAEAGRPHRAGDVVRSIFGRRRKAPDQPEEDETAPTEEATPPGDGE
jgi:acyl-[acyl-carrier-protein]-phospholipid O-acyltransferase / long-chain-fatty-acid--[acyl-carrier-protein] ligase